MLSAIRRLTSKLSEARTNHAIWRRPTGFRFAITDDVRFLNTADWDAAAQTGGFFLSRKYLEVLADHAPDNVSPRCALIYDGDAPVATIAAQIVELSGARMMKKNAPPSLKSALTPIAKKAATVQPVTLQPTYLPALAKISGRDFRCTVAKKDGAIVGFVTSVKDGETDIGYYMGYDRALAATGVPLYLRLLHNTIEHAMTFGCRQLSLERTALEPKSRLGAKPVPLHLWTRQRVPAVNWLLRTILQSVPHEEAPERNPFKAG